MAKRKKKKCFSQKVQPVLDILLPLVKKIADSNAAMREHAIHSEQGTLTRKLDEELCIKILSFPTGKEAAAILELSEELTQLFQEESTRQGVPIEQLQLYESYMRVQSALSRLKD